MAQKRRGPAKPVSKAEVAALSRKLDRWGSTLPAKEQALLQVMIGRAVNVRAADVRVQQVREKLGGAVKSAFADLLGSWRNVPEGWARIDPIWYKDGKVPQGDEVELNAKVLLKSR